VITQPLSPKFRLVLMAGIELLRLEDCSGFHKISNDNEMFWMKGLMRHFRVSCGSPE